MIDEELKRKLVEEFNLTPEEMDIIENTPLGELIKVDCEVKKVSEGITRIVEAAIKAYGLPSAMVGFANSIGLFYEYTAKLHPDATEVYLNSIKHVLQLEGVEIEIKSIKPKGKR